MCFSVWQVVGAVTYQILPPDTQFAEIPLAAVKKSHQRQVTICALSQCPACAKLLFVKFSSADW